MFRQKKLIVLMSALLPLACYQGVYANKIRGVNYDPVHSLEFAKAVGTSDCEGMKNAVESDFDKLAELQARNNGEFKSINYIKTFFSTFSSPDGKCTVNIADAVNDWNSKHSNNPLTLALGVYEFRKISDECQDDETCRTWTQGQVKAAIDAVNTYNKNSNHPLINQVIVGNEDIGDGDYNAVQIRQDIKNDIQTIKTQTNGLVRVGTAQTAGTVVDMLKNGKNADIFNVSDFIGANKYPYWDGIAYGTINASDDKSPAKMNFNNYWNDPVNGLNHLNTNKKELIESEEGWPSDGIIKIDAVASPVNANDYFKYWFYRGHQGDDNSNDPYVNTSYYFSLFDKLPGQSTESHWGIYSVDSYSSILDGDHSKPLAPAHPVVKFVNQVYANYTNPAREVTINACLEDYDHLNPNKPMHCYPIEGFAAASRIAAPVDPDNNDYASYHVVDISGKYYKSLVVVYNGGRPQWPRLCYVDAAHLSNYNNKTVVGLAWVNDSGNALCKSISISNKPIKKGTYSKK